MKNYKIVLTAVVILTVFVISCVSKNEKLIIGKWECSFNDSIEFRKSIFRNNKSLDKWRNELDTTDPNRKGTIIWEFNEDKTVRHAVFSTHYNGNDYGTYEFVNGDKFIKLIPEKGKGYKTCEIFELTKNKFKFLFNGDTVDLSKVEK
jgi:hypothetical protein